MGPFQGGRVKKVLFVGALFSRKHPALLVKLVGIVLMENPLLKALVKVKSY